MTLAEAWAQDRKHVQAALQLDDAAFQALDLKLFALYEAECNHVVLQSVGVFSRVLPSVCWWIRISPFMV